MLEAHSTWPPWAMVHIAFRMGNSAGYLSTGFASVLALGSGTPVATHMRTRRPLKMMMRSGSSCKSTLAISRVWMMHRVLEPYVNAQTATLL